MPGLDHLFTKNHKEAQETDVVVMLTPHIVRVLDLAEEDLRPLRLSREGAGPALIESAPVPPRRRSFATRRGTATPAARRIRSKTRGRVRVRPVPAPPVIKKRLSKGRRHKAEGKSVE